MALRDIIIDIGNHRNDSLMFPSLFKELLSVLENLSYINTSKFPFFFEDTALVSLLLREMAEGIDPLSRKVALVIFTNILYDQEPSSSFLYTLHSLGKSLPLQTFRRIFFYLLEEDKESSSPHKFCFLRKII